MNIGTTTSPFSINLCTPSISWGLKRDEGYVLFEEARLSFQLNLLGHSMLHADNEWTKAFTLDAIIPGILYSGSSSSMRSPSAFNYIYILLDIFHHIHRIIYVFHCFAMLDVPEWETHQLTVRPNRYLSSLASFLETVYSHVLFSSSKSDTFPLAVTALLKH